MSPRAGGLVVSLLIVLVALPLIYARAGSDEGIPSILVAPVSEQTAGQSLPPNGTVWCQYGGGAAVSRRQEAYFDNGDGVVSSGDEVQLDGARYSITAIGPSFYATVRVSCHCDAGTEEIGTSVLIPGDAHNPADPTGEIWTDIRFWDTRYFPGGPHLASMTVNNWGDCGPGGPPCEPDGILGPKDGLTDFVTGFPTGYTIDSVGVAVRINEFGAVPTRSTSWGEIKRKPGRS